MEANGDANCPAGGIVGNEDTAAYVDGMVKGGMRSEYFEGRKKIKRDEVKTVFKSRIWKSDLDSVKLAPIFCYRRESVFDDRILKPQEYNPKGHSKTVNIIGFTDVQWHFSFGCTKSMPLLQNIVLQGWKTVCSICVCFAEVVLTPAALRIYNLKFLLMYWIKRKVMEQHIAADDDFVVDIELPQSSPATPPPPPPSTNFVNSDSMELKSQMDVMSKKLDELVNDQDRFETTFLKFRESTDADAPKVDGVNAPLIEASAGDVLMEEAAKDTAATQVEEETVKDTEQVADDENEENCEQVAVEVVAREGTVDVDKGKNEKFSAEANVIDPPFSFGTYETSHKMWFYSLKKVGQCLNVLFYYFRKGLYHDSKSYQSACKVTNVDSMFDFNIRGWWSDFEKDPDKIDPDFEQPLSGDCGVFVIKACECFMMELQSPSRFPVADVSKYRNSLVVELFKYGREED
ncbi:hypothetical protein TIFTF001_022426 [Ficus carica]|uniref:Ubiquitin-like protease family profile domain-containing protein n=1 Tax=Ficus carica TaxID=3494 RepID=A0AA88AZJ0_FICCA|nr:hypothetical protein TIFTF001_022426 [Ficus carica]